MVPMAQIYPLHILIASLAGLINRVALENEEKASPWPRCLRR